MSTGLSQPVRLDANFSRPASATTYDAGDAIANSGTSSAVVPLTFLLPAVTNGQLIGCRAVVTPASSSLVITNLDFDLLVFQAATNIPFTAGSYPADNAAMDITAAAFRQLVATFSFVNTAWRNPAGGVTAGVTGTQAVAPALANATFSVAGLASQALIGVVQVRAAWNPGAIVNRFDFALNVVAP